MKLITFIIALILFCFAIWFFYKADYLLSIAINVIMFGFLKVVDRAPYQ
jgi:hypothetical protein